MLTYALVEFEGGVQLFQEAWFGSVLRYTDADGVTTAPPLGSSTVIDPSVARPAWAVDPPGANNGLSWSQPLSPEYFWIDVGPFFDRFGAKALTITSSTNTTVQGLITLILPRKYVDLKRADLPQMLGVLQQLGLVTSSEVTTVLNPVTTELERHIKGLPQPSA